MSFQHFPDTAYIKIFNHGVREKIGSFKTVEDTQLQYIVLTFMRVGAAAGSEQARILVYGSSLVNGTPLATSDWRSISDFTSGTNAIGRLRFDFNQQHIDKDITYHMAVETQNYTRNGDTFYLAAKLDWPDDVYTTTNALTRGAQIRIIGYR